MDESWAIRRPDKGEKERVGAAARLITINKSREGNEGKQLVLRQQADLTFELKDLPAEGVEEGSPASIVDRVLQRLRTRGVPMTRKELNADPVVGGSVEGIRKALERLVDRGLVTAEGKASYKRFQAVSARRGVPLETVQNDDNSSTGAESQALERPEVSKTVQNVSVFSAESGAGQKTDTKRTDQDSFGHSNAAKPSSASGSEGNGHESGELFTREERTPAELAQLMQEAADFWS
ncbi:hypothetical protein EBT31_17315 [bacterium]|nr:hypothetical protein [bacterium]